MMGSFLDLYSNVLVEEVLLANQIRNVYSKDNEYVLPGWKNCPNELQILTRFKKKGVSHL
jgi:hypothetical protein